MAITLVGSTSGTAQNGGNVTLTMPVGTAENDLVVIAGGHSLPSAEAGTSTSGFNEWADVSNGSAFRFAVAYKFMTSSPDASVVGLGSGDADDGVAYLAYVFRGVDTGTPIDAAGGVPTPAQATSTNPNAPSITTQTANAWVVVLAGSSVSDAAKTVPSGYTNDVQTNQGNDTRDVSIAGATLDLASPGAQDPPGWTGWNSGPWVAVTLALRPAGGAAANPKGVFGLALDGPMRRAAA